MWGKIIQFKLCTYAFDCLSLLLIIVADSEVPSSVRLIRDFDLMCKASYCPMGLVILFKRIFILTTINILVCPFFNDQAIYASSLFNSYFCPDINLYFENY